MTPIASIVLIGWLPIVAVLFAALPPGRATVVAFVVGWLFLPVGGFALPGLPDYTKVTAASIGVMIAGMALASAPILRLRLGPADVSIVTWCLCYFASSMSNDLGFYNSVSMVISSILTYGLPYFMGRAYLGNQRGIKDLANGIVAGALAYVPLCLYEVRFSPQLHRQVYGMLTSDHAIAQSIRYGGFRPIVFMVHGLEVGMWMASGTLIACWLWASGAAKRIASGRLSLVLLTTTVLCKSTGSILLLAVGLAVLWASRRAGKAAPALALAAIVPLYCAVRTAGLWDGSQLASAAKGNLGADRADSLEFRLKNEDMLISKAMMRPLFGWGGWGRARVYNEEGRDTTITDGWWVIALGDNGVVGLASLIGILVLPLVVLCRRCSPRRWGDSEVAPYAAIAVQLALYMIDNLSNAMFNPVYFLAAGALLSPRALECDSADREVPDTRGPDEDLALAWEHAESLEREARSGDGDWAEVARAWGRVVGGARDRGDPANQDLATAERRLGLALSRLGRWGEAIEARGRALKLLAELAALRPVDDAISLALASEMDALARLLSVAEDLADRDPSHAVSLASQAVRMVPGIAAYHNTLGAAFLRAGDWSAAVSAIGRSIALDRRGGTRSDHLFLAIAHARLGDRDAARTSLREADLKPPGPGSGPPEMEDLRIDTIRLLADDPDSPGPAGPAIPPPSSGATLP